jgi:hypothetical protein
LKKKSLQWEFVHAKIFPQVSEAAMIVKERAIRQWLDATDGELAELAEVKEDPDEEDVNEREEITTETNN